MAVQLIEGFEGGDLSVLNLDAPSGGAGIGGVPSDAPGTWSKYHYKGGSSGEIAKGLKSQDQTEIFIHARRFHQTNNTTLFRVVNPSGGTQCTINASASGVVNVADATGAVIGIGTTTLTLNQWHLIEAHVRIGDATGSAGTWGIVEVRLDGQTTNEITCTNVDTKNGSNTTIGWVGFQDGTNFGSHAWDDIIIYDSSGSTNNSWVGDSGVYAIFPNGRGTSEQWNLPTVSAQRFYFPDYASSDGLMTVRPTNSRGYGASLDTITPAALWDTLGDNAGNIIYGQLSPYRQGSAIRSKRGQSNGFTTTVTDADVLMAQFVSPSIAAQTITGTVHMQMQALESTGTDDHRSQLVVRVVSEDGTTVRGTLYGGDTGSLTDEWATSMQNVTFPQDSVSPATMSSVVCSDGDRIVVEFGFRRHGAAISNRDPQIRLGDGGASGDLPDSESDTTTSNGFNAWIEFSNAITMSDNSNWELLDEAFGPDDNTDSREGTYVTTGTDNDLDFYQFDNIPANLTMNGPISIKVRAKKTDPGTRTLTHVYKTSGGTQTPPAKGLTTSYSVTETLLDVDGTDSAVWTDAKINGIQAGIKATT